MSSTGHYETTLPDGRLISVYADDKEHAVYEFKQDYGIDVQRDDIRLVALYSDD